MDTGLIRQAGLVTIAEGQVLRLPEAAGRHLTVVHGNVWITQLGDPRDPVLGSGASFRFERSGVSLAQALGGPAVLLLEEGLLSRTSALAGAQSAVARARLLTQSEAFQREAHRLRAEAISAAMAGAFGRLKSAARALWSGLQRFVRASAESGTLNRLNDHQLRDLGLRRDQVRFGGLTRVCGYC